MAIVQYTIDGWGTFDELGAIKYNYDSTICNGNFSPVTCEVLDSTSPPIDIRFQLMNQTGTLYSQWRVYNNGNTIANGVQSWVFYSGDPNPCAVQGNTINIRVTTNLGNIYNYNYGDFKNPISLVDIQCPSGYYKSGNLCLQQVCDPTNMAHTCNGNNVQQCNSNGSGYNIIQTCTNGCSNGSCNPIQQVCNAGFHLENGVCVQDAVSGSPSTSSSSNIVIAILLALAVAGGGYYFYKKRKSSG